MADRPDLGDTLLNGLGFGSLAGVAERPGVDTRLPDLSATIEAARAGLRSEATAVSDAARKALDPYLSALGLVDAATAQRPTAAAHVAYTPTDEWGALKLGPATFNLPPISMTVTEVNSSAAAAFIVRSRTSSKVNPGNKAVRVEIGFIFRTYDDLVGSEDAWGQVNSLRGLVTLFRSAPFLPVKNGYLNDVWNIDMLAMESLQIGTMPGFPFAITATLTAYQFNWRALVPVAGTAWDLLNEDRFLYHYSQAKKALDDYVSAPFDPSRLWAGYDNTTEHAIDGDTKAGYDYDFKQRQREAEIGSTQWESDEKRLKQLFGPLRVDHLAAGQLELYYTDRDMASEMWLSDLKKSKVIDPSNVEGGLAKAISDAIGTAGLKAVLDGAFGGDPADLAVEVQQSLATTLNNNDEQLKVFKAYQFILSVGEYAYGDEDATRERIASLTRSIMSKNPGMRADRARELAYVTTTLMDQEAILKSKRVLKALQDADVAWFHEWEIPMRRLGLMNAYLADHVIVESIGVGTQNALTPLPIAGKVSGVHQHFGCLGTTGSITLKVKGEDALSYLKDRLDRISYAAMRNKDNGVSGFLGVENHLLNLMGVKYAMLDSVQVATIEGQPHTYQLVLQFSDFDVFQQKRETPTAIERLGIAERMAKGHPVMRARQELSRMNAYPDMPLPRRRVKRTAIVPKQSETSNEMSFDVKEVLDWGPYYDPDYYFNSAYMYYEDESGQPVEAKRDAKGRPLGIPTFVSKLNYFVPDMKKVVQVVQSADAAISMSVKKTIEDTFSSGDYFGPIISTIAKALGVGESAPEDLQQATPSPAPPAGGDADTKEGKTQKVFDSLTVGRTYVPGENEASSASWLSKLKGGKDADGKKVEDNDILAALSRMLVYGNDEQANVQQMLREHHYAQTEGRMVQAFPTCVVYLIDEGDFYLTYRLYDTFYGMQGLISADVTLDKDAPNDLAVLQFSNLYGKLSQAAWWQNFSLPKFIMDTVNTARNIKQRAMGYVDEMESIKLETGMRVQIRFGYSADPTQLPIVFNGSIAEVSDGQTLTIVAQGDGAELNKVTEKNFGPGQTEGKHKWQYLWMNAPFVEPQQLLIKLLAGEGSAWAEAVKRASAGIAPNQASNAAPHFGACIWDTTKLGGDRAFRQNVRKTVKNIAEQTKKNVEDMKKGASTTGDGKSSNSILGAAGLARTAWNVLEIGIDASDDVAAQYWSNEYNLLQDFELYKRNIYPGNGTGMRGWETDPRPVNSIFGIIGHLWFASDPDFAFKEEDTDSGDTEERAFSLNSSGKTNWDIGKACEALMPNYILAVRPFEHRSTLFYGKQNWLYTSGVIPFFDGDTVDPERNVGDWQKDALALNEVYEANQDGISQSKVLDPTMFLDLDWGGGSAWKTYESKTDGAIKMTQGANLWGWYWVKDPRTMKKIHPSVESSMPYDQFMGEWAGFMAWAGENGIINDVLMGHVVANSLYECPANNARGWNSQQMHREGTGLGSKATYGSTGPRGEDVWIDADKDPVTYSILTGAYNQWKRLDRGAKQPDLKLKAWLAGSAVSAGFISGKEVIVDITKLASAINNVGKTADEGKDKDTKPKTEKPGNSDVADAMDAVRNAVAVMISETVGGWEAMLEMSAKNDVNSQLEWRALEDNSYYGVLAGTPFDPYAGAEYYYDPNKKTESFNSYSIWGGGTRKDNGGRWIIDWFDNKDPYGVVAKSEKLDRPGDIAGTVAALILGPGVGKWVHDLVDGAVKEPPEEVRKLRAAQIMTDNPFTKEFGEPVVEIREPFSRFHTITSETNLVANTLTADETQVFNQVVAIAHAKAKNDGSKKVTVKADKSIPPHLTKETVVDTGLNYSMFNFYDGVNHKNMALWHLKRSLQQMYGGELVCLGNPFYRPYDFAWLWDSTARMNGMFEVGRVTHHFGIDTGFVTSVKAEPIVMVEDAHLFHILNMFGMNRHQEHSLRVYSQNVAAGAVDRYQAEAEAQRLRMEDIHRQTMGILDGNPNSGQQIGLASILSPFLQHADGAGGKVPTSKEIEKAGKDLARPQDTTDVPDTSKSGRLSRVNLALGAILPGAALGTFLFGAAEQAIGAALESPLQVITLYKDGRPFQAGLRGARGIIVGEPGRLPLLTDWFGYETLPADPATVWSKFGYKLDTALQMRDAQSEAELLAIEELEKLSGRTEADVDDEVGATSDVFATTVQGIVDGDTYLFPMADLPAELQGKVKPSREDPSLWSCRMRYLDAPEIPHPGQEYEPYSEDKPNYGGLEVKDWVETVRLPKGSPVKIRYNKARPTDEYERMLVVLVDRKSSSHYDDDAFIKSSQFSWMRESINGEMLTSNAEIKVWTDAAHTTYVPKLLRDLVQPLFTVPDEDGMYLRR